MGTDLAGMLLLGGSFALTFLAARVLSKRFRQRRREREEVVQRAGESRQVRRARERRGRAGRT